MLAAEGVLSSLSTRSTNPPGSSIPDVDALFEARLLGVPVDTNAIPEDDDQEPNAPTKADDISPDWE